MATLISIRTNKLDVGELRGSEKELAELAESMKGVGLIHPVILNSKHQIVAGRRRVHAAEKLGWTHINALVCDSFDDHRKALLAERDENTCRLALKPTEMKRLADLIRAEERPKAEIREKAGKKTGLEPSPKFGEGSKHTSETDQKAAEAAGTSRETLRKIDEVVEAAEAEPEKFGDLPAAMDAKGKVDPVHKELKRRQEEAEKETPADPLADAAKAFCSRVNSFTRQVDDLSQQFGELRKNPLGHDIHWETVLSHLTAVRKALHQGRPKRPCPYCKATGKKGKDSCKACKETGHVCESIYRSGCAAVGVPAEKGDDE